MRCDECLRTLTEHTATMRKDGSLYIIFECGNCKTRHRIDTHDLHIQKSVIE